MTIASIVQQFSRRSGVQYPATVVGSTDDGVLQMLALLEEEGNDLASRGAWESLTREATLTTVATESQGTVASIATNGFRYIKNQTIWDRTDKLPVLGATDSVDWQALKAMASTGPRYQYRIRGGELLVNPVPAAGHDWRFEYVSQNWILGADGTTYKQYATLDTDTVLLPETLLIMGLRWRWLKEKGLNYAESFNSYEAQVKDALGRDGGKPVLQMEMDDRRAKPGVWIPSGSWI